MKVYAFTLVEVLVCVIILAAIAALSYPVLIVVKKESKKAQCMSNLKQYGLAISLYREQYSKADFGLPSEMGIPPDGGPLNLMNLKCEGSAPGPGYTFVFTHDEQQNLIDRWLKESQHYRDEMVIMYDVSHQDSFPKSFSWERWHAIGLRLNGSTMVRVRMGYPFSTHWWN